MFVYLVKYGEMFKNRDIIGVYATLDGAIKYAKTFKERQGLPCERDRNMEDTVIKRYWDSCGIDLTIEKHRVIDDEDSD